MKKKKRIPPRRPYLVPNEQRDGLVVKYTPTTNCSCGQPVRRFIDDPEPNYTPTVNVHPGLKRYFTPQEMANRKPPKRLRLVFTPTGPEVVES